jgi:hypothetical protein
VTKSHPEGKKAEPFMAPPFLFEQKSMMHARPPHARWKQAVSAKGRGRNFRPLLLFSFRRIQQRLPVVIPVTIMVVIPISIIAVSARAAQYSILVGDIATAPLKVVK